VFVMQGSGQRLLVLEPVEGCSINCSRVSVLLKPSDFCKFLSMLVDSSIFLILSFRRVLYVVFFLLGNSPGALVLIADVSVPSISSMFMGRWMKYDWGWDVRCIYT